MLQLREEQIAALAVGSRANFEERLLGWIEERYPEKAARLTEQQLRWRIHAAVGRAAGYGITGEKPVARFVGLDFEVGESFDTDPACAWAGEILRRPDLDGIEKLAELESRRYAVGKSGEDYPGCGVRFEEDLPDLPVE